MENVKTKEGLEDLEPKFNTKPRVHYKNLYLYKKCFIGGTIAISINGVEDCLEGAIVILNKGGNKLGEEISDVFGEFKFDGLDPNSGSYQMEILHPEYQSLSVNLDLVDSIYTGVHSLTSR